MEVVKNLDLKFKEEVVKRLGGENLNFCYQCGTCSLGCPVSKVRTDYDPRQIIRMVIWGMKEDVLSSEAIWLCSTCYTCFERCPQDVKITELFNVLKNMAAQEGYIHPSHKVQVKLIGGGGRLYEIEEFDNKKRERSNLPKLQPKFEDVPKLLKGMGIDKYIKEGEK